MIPAELAIKHMVVGVGVDGGRPPGRYRQPPRRRDDVCAQPGHGLEGPALPGHPG